MPIQLHDSLTRTLKPLTASQPDGVFRFYNCGPTVYAPAHIGNFRTFIVNDILRRLLEIEFGPTKVRHVRNLTDVDDRTIQQARKEGRPLPEITARWTAKFHADCAALGCLPPHVEPTATGHIREQVDMIECLMERGNAYRAADGSVYFRISSFPEYGALSRIKERELKITNDAADSDHKDSVSDFALWKAYKPEEDGDVQWPGPRGAAAGRPGWHVECSAMIKKHLGETIDLHTGGVDLLFPHHENEIAQSQCCNGGTTFANHWYHSEHLLVEGTTMSKSKGNYYTLSDLTAKGYPAMAVRYALLAGHPRKQLNFTLDSLHAAERALKTLRSYREKLAASAGATQAENASGAAAGAPQKNGSNAAATTQRQEIGGIAPFFGALCDDLNTPAALGILFTLVNRGPGAVSLAEFDRALFALGLDLSTAQNTGTAPADIPPEVAALAEKRWAAKAAKDWPSADALRAEIAALGWAMLDRKDGYSLEPQKK
ncbi:cysteine--tRNA ligase [Cephaloticoccus primus]|uniref:Cysteine--tRNA ligase n=1 Tax=Cephaloticoccus primus TaxID=1548207 RepID=A0A139STL2_9BACT|nr:cysteine--tRNA ligase [Cephaloticoccus primus]KXU37916.1 cysteine--tRNA ligase [Cephaloticoccus primus]